MTPTPPAHIAAADTDRYVVTGPSGWIGRGFVSLLCDRLGADWADRIVAFGSNERALPIGGGRMLPVRHLDGMTPADVAGVYVIHLAHLGGEQVAVRGSGDFVRINNAIDDIVLDATAQAPARALFVSSSGMAREAAAGAASVYGAGKLVQEARFLSRAAAQDTRLLVGRIFNVAGPFMNKRSLYALGSFLAQARERGVIEVAATAPVYRSYLHVLDRARLVLAELHGDHPLPASPVDLAGSFVTEMDDVARAAAAAYGLGAEAVRRAPLRHDGGSRYLGDAVPARGMALRHGIALQSFEQQVIDTARYLDGGSL